MIMPERSSCAWDYPNSFIDLYMKLFHTSHCDGVNRPDRLPGGGHNKLINNYLQIQRAIKDPLIALDVAY